MGKKTNLVFCLAAILISIPFSGCKAETLITKELKSVEKISITYEGISIVLNNNKDKSVIKEIYDCIMKTRLKTLKNPTEMDSQLSDPLYIIDISFNDASKNTINSTESGELIYRFLDKQGSWVGGENSSLKEKVLALFHKPQPQLIKNFSLKRLKNTETTNEYPATIITRYESTCIFKEIEVIDNYKYFRCNDLNGKELFLAMLGDIDDQFINEFENNKDYINKKVKIKWNKVRAYYPEDKRYYIESVLFEVKVLE